MDVSVRELKRQLSAYLERAARGELIRVTDRGKPKALLGPLRDTSAVERGIREGWLHPGNGEPPGSVVPIVGQRRVIDVLREDREDR
jgi:prevent-host-death family protein